MRRESARASESALDEGRGALGSGAGRRAGAILQQRYSVQVPPGLRRRFRFFDRESAGDVVLHQDLVLGLEAAHAGRCTLDSGAMYAPIGRFPTQAHWGVTIDHSKSAKKLLDWLV